MNTSRNHTALGHFKFRACMKKLLPALGALLALAASITSLAGQTQITLYEHTNYGGKYINVFPGEGIPNLHNMVIGQDLFGDYQYWGDEVSSVGIWGNLRIRLYEDANYNGAYIDIFSSAAELPAGWNDFVSSVYVTYADVDTLAMVTLWEDTNYEGESIKLIPSQGLTSMRDFEFDEFFGLEDWDNELSSVEIAGSVQLRLYEHANYMGEFIDLYESAARLPQGWNDRVSSVYVFASAGEVLWDATLQSWIYWTADSWAYHYAGLGWLAGSSYNRSMQSGWLYDPHYGWMYTSLSYYPWFYRNADGIHYYYDHGSSNPRYFKNNATGQWEESYNN